jgi:hypothetical protein
MQIVLPAHNDRPQRVRQRAVVDRHARRFGRIDVGSTDASLGESR